MTRKNGLFLTFSYYWPSTNVGAKRTRGRVFVYCVYTNFSLCRLQRCGVTYSDRKSSGYPWCARNDKYVTTKAFNRCAKGLRNRVVVPIGPSCARPDRRGVRSVHDKLAAGAVARTNSAPNNKLKLLPKLVNLVPRLF